ncbi:MAG: hypothetical protein HC902_10295 [Calothrix sp. SM1_5_4]|nr:hypothetical protein [Calothrix sp. SM1_5_4]
MRRALHDVFVGGYHADKVIQRQMKLNKKWGSHDRKLFASGVYDIVRWWRRLLAASGVPWPESDRWDAADPEVYSRVIEAWCLLNGVELAKSVPRRGLSLEEIESQWNDPTMPRAARESIPDWLDAWAWAQLGEDWDKILPALNTEAPVYLRANRLRVSPEELRRELPARRSWPTLRATIAFVCGSGAMFF